MMTAQKNTGCFLWGKKDFYCVSVQCLARWDPLLGLMGAALR